jgi:hypothetical protein
MTARNRFSYPSAEDVERWCALSYHNPPRGLAGNSARTIRRSGRAFTSSILLPAATAFAVAGLMASQVDRIPSEIYWILLAGLAVLLFVFVGQWRTLLTKLSPRLALYYYCAACIDRSRRFDQRQDVLSYLRIILPVLDRTLTSSRHASQYAGSQALRMSIAAVLQSASNELARRERLYLSESTPEHRASLAEVLGAIVVYCYFELWVNRAEDAKTATPGPEQTQSTSVEHGSLLGTLVKTTSDKAIEQFVLAIGALLVAVVPKLM